MKTVLNVHSAENPAPPESSSARKKCNKATQTEATQGIIPYPAAPTEHAPPDDRENAAAVAVDVENGCNCQSNNCLECQSRDRDTLFDMYVLLMNPSWPLLNTS